MVPGYVAYPGSSIGQSLLTYPQAGACMLCATLGGGVGLHLASAAYALLAAWGGRVMRCAAYVLGVTIYFFSLNSVYGGVVMAATWVTLEPAGVEWRVPDDGLDPPSRRAFKSSLSCAFFLLAASRFWDRLAA